MGENSVKFGDVRLEGGRLNYSKPLLLDNGRKLAASCNSEIRIINTSNGCHISTLSMHSAKVVGLYSLSLGDQECIFSCDGNGEMFVWNQSADGVHCQPLGKFPIPSCGVVEHIAYVGHSGEIVLVVEMNRNKGPRELLLQRNKDHLVTDKFTVLVSRVLPGCNAVSFSSVQKFCAVLTSTHSGPACNIIPIHGKGMTIVRKNRRIITGERIATCVAVHPTQEAVAVGDHFGGIVLYYDVLQERPSGVRRLHWHHMPVGDLLFSLTGQELYSCGEEGVLVQWHLSKGGTNDRSFLPRLGQPITRLTLSQDNAVLVATHRDNSFSVVDVLQYKLMNVLLGHGLVLEEKNLNTAALIVATYMKNKKSLCNGVYYNKPNGFIDKSPVVVSSKSQGLSHALGNCIKPKFSNNQFLLFDNRTKSILSKSKPGYLQFYHVYTHQQLFLVDVVEENFVPEASRVRDVQQISLSSDCCTMATVDAIIDSPHSQILKFWSFDHSNARWRLDTSVVYPHNFEIQGCLIQPHSVLQQEMGVEELSSDTMQCDDYSDRPFCVTWDQSGLVKMWAAVDENDRIQWGTVSSTTYKSDETLAVGAWSPCGTRLALSHGATVSLWRPDSLTWQGQLSKPNIIPHVIFAMEFSPSVGGRVLVVATEGGVAGWCLRLRRLLYFAPLSAVALAADHSTGLMVVSTLHGELILFRGQEGVPLARLDAGAYGPRCLAFCPPLVAELYQYATLLLFYNEHQDLMSVPVYLFGALSAVGELANLRSSLEEPLDDTKPAPSKLKLMVAGSSSGQTSVSDESLFAFRHIDKNKFVPPNFFVKVFSDTIREVRSLEELIGHFDNLLNAGTDKNLQ